MSKVRIPTFLVGTPKEKLGETLTEYHIWQRADTCEKLVGHLEDKLEKLLLEEEKDSPLSLFQSKYNRAKNLGKREILRSIIKDLKTN